MGYNVSFFINGYGTQPESLTDISILPELPVLEEAGFIFEGWYLDEELTTPAEAGMEINSDVTLYASWARDRRPATSTTEEDSGSSTYAVVDKPLGPGGDTITGKYAINAGCLYYGNSSIDLKLLETDHTNYLNSTVFLPKTTLSGWTWGSSNKSLQVVKYPSSAPSLATKAYGFYYGQYIDLPPYFDAESSPYSLKALKAGYLPLSPSCVTDFLTYAVDNYTTRYYGAQGNTVRTYTFVRKTSCLAIYYCDKTVNQITGHPSSPAAAANWTLATTWPASSFPGEVVPYRVYVQIQAGGGSGGYGGSGGGGGGGAYWAGIVNCENTGVFIELGKPGLWANKTDNNGTAASPCYVGFAYQAGQYYSFSSSKLVIYGGKAGGTSGNASNTTSYHAGGTVATSDRNTSYYWTCKTRNGGAGGKSNVAGTGGATEGETWYLENQAFGTTATMHYVTATTSGGAGQPNGGGGGGGASMLGTGAKGQAGTWGSTTINKGSGYGYGGGGGGNAQKTPGDGGNWCLWITY